MRFSWQRWLCWQWAIATGLSAVLVLGCWWVGAAMSVALSFVCGTVVVLVPNSLVALRVWVSAQTGKMHAARAPAVNPTQFFWLEFLKIAMTIALMAIVVNLYHDLRWLPFLLGLVVMLKSYFLIWFWLR